MHPDTTAAASHASPRRLKQGLSEFMVSLEPETGNSKRLMKKKKEEVPDLSTLRVRICTGRGFGDAMAFIASASSGSKEAIFSTVKDVQHKSFHS